MFHLPGVSPLISFDAGSQVSIGCQACLFRVGVMTQLTMLDMLQVPVITLQTSTATKGEPW
jgi:hypothetical protein